MEKGSNLTPLPSTGGHYEDTFAPYKRTLFWGTAATAVVTLYHPIYGAFVGTYVVTRVITSVIFDSLQGDQATSAHKIARCVAEFLAPLAAAFGTLSLFGPTPLTPEFAALLISASAIGILWTFGSLSSRSNLPDHNGTRDVVK